MSEKSWKRTERKIAELLGGERVPVNGRIRGSAPDIEHATLSLEVKSRKSVPAWLTEALAQATASAAEGSDKLPVAVIHQQGKPHTDSLCVIRLEDLAELLQKGDTNE